ncbi:MAG TPA: DUF748 domain-containing protein [Burkholderiales bacterium]|jgi:uncharacterized protein involved in outer membrane biogenesis
MVLRPRTRWILLGVSAFLLAGYAAAGFFVVPRVAHSQIVSFVTETLHRKIDLGEIRFNPFTFEANIADLKLADADGAPLVAFRHLKVNAELASLWHRGVVLKELELVAPDVNLVIAPDGSANLARLAPPAGPAPEKPKADERPLPVRIGTLSIVEGRLGFEDRTHKHPFTAELTPISFSLSDFRTDVGHQNAYSFSGKTRAAERLDWNGTFTVQPLGSSGTVNVTDLRLATIDAYLEDILPIKLASGTGQFGASYQFELQPLALEITAPSVKVRDLSLAERGASAAAPIVIPQLDADSFAFSLSRHDVGFKRLDARGARVDIVREADGTLNLSRLFATSPSSPPEKQPNDSGAPWTVHADVIALDGSTVATEDRTTSPPARIRLSPVGITVGGWSTAAEAPMKLDAKIGIEQRGLLTVAGDVGLEPPSAKLAVDLKDFPLPVLQPYIAQSTAMTLHSGRLGVKGNVAFTAPADKPVTSKITGEVRVDDVRTTDRLLREDFVKWSSLAITGIQFQQQPDRLRIDRIVARKPYARVVIAEDGTVNVSEVLAPQKEAPKKEVSEKKQKASASKPFPVAIGTVQVIDGSANFADHSLQPNFASGIVGLNGKVSGLSSDPRSRAKVAISGSVDQYSPVDLSGEVNLLSAAVYSDVALKFKNIELTTFNPYSGKFAGYAISKGKLSTAMKYRVEDRKLDAQHHIVVDNLEFGDKTDSKDAAPIPIKFGVALLKDKRGVIELDLPVSGTLDDPQFRLGPLIWKAVVGLLSKIVTAPFAAIGAMFGGGDELAFVDFQPGSATLTEDATRKLATLANGLAERPQIRLNVPNTIATAADSDVVAKQALATLIPPVDTSKPFDDVAKRKRLDAFETVYRARLKTMPVYPAEIQASKDPNLDARLGFVQSALLDHLKPTPAALDTLGQQRAAAVRNALLSNKELSPERVFIVVKPMEAAPAPGAVRMEMKLE